MVVSGEEKQRRRKWRWRGGNSIVELRGRRERVEGGRGGRLEEETGEEEDEVV